MRATGGDKCKDGDKGWKRMQGMHNGAVAVAQNSGHKSRLVPQATN